MQVATDALRAARGAAADYLLVDTAGRLHVDEDLMEELARVREAVKPHQTILVLDGMVGQDAVRSSRRSATRMPIDGVALTKMDGDARGGARSRVRAATGVPILVRRDGREDLGARGVPSGSPRLADPRHGGRALAGREACRRPSTLEKAQQLQRRLEKRQFTLEDFLDQIRQIGRWDRSRRSLKMVPGARSCCRRRASFDEREMVRVEAILQSMTPGERQRPEIINGSRRRRIARGSGTVCRT